MESGKMLQAQPVSQGLGFSDQPKEKHSLEHCPALLTACSNGFIAFNTVCSGGIMAITTDSSAEYIGTVIKAFSAFAHFASTPRILLPSDRTRSEDNETCLDDERVIGSASSSDSSVGSSMIL